MKKVDFNIDIIHEMVFNNHYIFFFNFTGSMLDVDRKEIIFYHNGKPLQAFSNVFEQVLTGFFAAASFMSFQQCQVIYIILVKFKFSKKATKN